MKIIPKSLTVILFCLSCFGQNLPNISTQTKGQLPTSRLSGQGVAGLCLQTDGLGGMSLLPCPGASSGTVTLFSAGSLSQLFTTSVSNPATTPTLNFALASFTAHTFYGNNTSGTAIPGAQSIGLSDLPGSGSVTVNTAGPLGGGGSLALGASLNLTCASCITSIPQLAITKTLVASNWINSYDSTTGLFTATRPAYTDLIGLPQLAVTKTAIASNWLRSFDSTTGLFTATQPATSDLSDFPSQAGNSGKFLSTNGTVLSFAAGGTGTVTSFSSGNLSPLFTTSVATATTTPSQSFSLSTASAHTFFGNNTASTTTPAYSVIGNGDLPGTGAVTLNTTAPITGGGSVALGNALTFACASCLTSVTAHNLLSATHGDTTTHAVLRGDLIAGIGVVPTWTAVAKGGTNTYPKWNASGDVISSTLAASGIGSPTSCTNQAVTAFTLSADAAPTSTCTTITSTFTSGTFSPNAHNILSVSHGDTTAASAVRGDGFFAIGASSTWQRLAHPVATGGYFKWNGTDVVASTGAASGTGSCASHSFETADNSDAAPTCTQPSASDLSDGTTGTGAVVRAISPALTGTPTSPTQSTGDNTTAIATDQFVTTAINNAIAGVNPAVAVQAASAAVLPNSPTYLNGASGIGATLTAGVTNTALVVDGYTPVLLDRILVKNQASSFQNGVYSVSQVSGIGLAWILTRALDYDQPSDMNNTGAIPVANGIVNLDTSWVQTSQVTTVGTDAVTFTQFSLNPTTLVVNTRNINTTSPITGGGNLTADRTIACATCVTSSSPGPGIAHFSGSTQAVTSSPITSTDTTGTFPATAHNLLSATHGDSTTGTVARGDVITGQGVSAAWARLAKGAASQCLQMDGTATDVTWGSCATGGTGASTADTFITVAHDADLTAERILSCTSGDLTCTDGGANNAFTLDTGANIPKTTTSNTYSTGTSQNMDTITAKYWGSAPIFDATKYTGTDMCDKIAAVYSDAVYIATAVSIIDARGFTGNQNCATTNPFGTTHSTKWIFNAGLHVNLTRFAATLGPATSSLIAPPSAPTLATSTTTGSLGAAIGVGVKVEYGNFAGPTTPSSEATITTGAGTTNIVTVTSPAVAFGATCYDVFSATPVGSGWKKNNTTGCIPLGTNYVIKNIGAGAIPDTTNLAANDQYEVDFGNSTWSAGNSSGAIIAGISNTYIHDLKFVNNGTANNGNALVYVNSNLTNVILDRIDVSGALHGVASFTSGNIQISNIRCSNPTVSGSCVFVLTGDHVKVSNVSMYSGVWPTGGNLQGVVNLSGCIDCSVDGVTANNLDISNLVNGAAIIVQGSSLRTNINDVSCDGLINSDCVLITAMSLQTNITNVNCANTKVGTGAGIGANANNGDCLDFFSAGRVNATSINCQSMGLVGGQQFPCYEVFNVSEVALNNLNAYDSSGIGLRLFGTTGATITGGHFNRNKGSGIQVEDTSAVVTCNNTTTVTYVSGQPFGPWAPGTTVQIGAGPTAFQLASVPTSSNTITLTAACNLGASQAFSVYSQDTHIVGVQADDNGQGLGGANTQSGISVLGHSQVDVVGGSMNDNRATASKTQQWGISATPAGGQTARMRVIGADFTNNLGATCSGTEYGANVTGNHGACDGNKLSAFLFDDNVGPKWTIGAASTVDASLNIPAGTTPTTPVAGDFWNDATSVTYRDPTSGINQYIPKKIYLTGNYTNSTTSLTNVTSGNTLAFAVAANKDYAITCELFYQTASTGGLQIGFTGPASPTAVNYSVMVGTTATTINNGEATAFTTKIPTVGVAATATTNFPAHVALMLRNGANAGTVTLQAASVAAVQLTINNTSFCTVQ